MTICMGCLTELEEIRLQQVLDVCVRSRDGLPQHCLITSALGADGAMNGEVRTYIHGITSWL